MAKYVPDISSRRWVIISSSRISRPDEFLEKKPATCPFCPGNEKQTSGEVFRFGDGKKDEPGWKVRVIPNKYPITDFHEVIIHSPDEDKDFEDLPLTQVALIIKTYKERYNFYREKGEVIIFCNHGEHAGASIKHPHSQLVVIPNQINLDTLSREPLNNMVEENTFFNVYCPDFSQWPYEVWIAPKKENTFFGDIADDEIEDLAQILQQTLLRVKKAYERNTSFHRLPFAYNFYVSPKENWYIRITPRFVHRAGFELGTGLEVNIVDPKDAMKELQDSDQKINGVLDKLKKY